MHQTISSVFQYFPEFRGKRRICKWILKLLVKNKGKKHKIRSKYGVFLLPNLIESVSTEIFINGYYEKGLVDHLVASLPENGVFLDIGANIGSISIPLALKRPDIKIYAYEASPWIFKVFEANINLNEVNNIFARNNAVYSKSDLLINIYAPKDLFGKGSLKSSFTSEAELVNTIAIDEIKSNFVKEEIHYIKVDVEGFELAVFQGALNVLNIDKPKIIFEFNTWSENEAGYSPGSAQKYLLENDYVLQPLGVKFEPAGNLLTEILTSEVSNFLAIHKNKL